MDFSVGMHIRYGSTGICRIDRVDDIPFPSSKQPRRCYVLTPLQGNSMEILVPLDNTALRAKMKAMLTKSEVDTLLSDSAAEVPPWITDRKQRAAAFRQTLSSGDTAALIGMMRCIDRHRAETERTGKKLSASDENAWRDAQHMLGALFSYALELSEEQVADYVKERICV